MADRVRIMSEVAQGERCAVCEQRFDPCGDLGAPLGDEWAHDPECPDYYWDKKQGGGTDAETQGH